MRLIAVIMLLAGCAMAAPPQAFLNMWRAAKSADAVDPLTLGVYLWWDSSQMTYTNEQTVSSQVQEFSAVNWSTNTGVHSVTAADRPKYIDGRLTWVRQGFYGIINNFGSTVPSNTPPLNIFNGKEGGTIVAVAALAATTGGTTNYGVWSSGNEARIDDGTRFNLYAQSGVWKTDWMGRSATSAQASVRTTTGGTADTNHSIVIAVADWGDDALSLYQGGTLLSSTNNAEGAGVAEGNSRLRLGGRASASGQGFLGPLSEVQVYDYAFTPAQVAAMTEYLKTKWSIP